MRLTDMSHRAQMRVAEKPDDTRQQRLAQVRESTAANRQSNNAAARNAQTTATRARRSATTNDLSRQYSMDSYCEAEVLTVLGRRDADSLWNQTCKYCNA